MPTRSEVRLYTLGMRLQQALIITRAGASKSASIVHGVMAQLVKAIDDLGLGTPFSASELQALQDLKKPCRVLQRQIVRSEEDYFLDEAYDEFRRRSQLILSAFELSTDTFGADAGRRWFQLGFVIVDGHDDEPEMSDEPDGFEDGIDDEPPDGADDGGDAVATSEELAWHWSNGDFVERLRESLDVPEGSVFPADEIELSQAMWMEQLPDFVRSWARFEAGLVTIRSISADDPIQPPIKAGFKPPFVGTPLQNNILNALNGRALKKVPLADLVANGDWSGFYRPGGIKELMEQDLVRKKSGIGYYRPDAPPKMG